jgi:hypothetical protein
LTLADSGTLSRSDPAAAAGPARLGAGGHVFHHARAVALVGGRRDHGRDDGRQGLGGQHRLGLLDGRARRDDLGRRFAPGERTIQTALPLALGARRHRLLPQPAASTAASGPRLHQKHHAQRLGLVVVHLVLRAERTHRGRDEHDGGDERGVQRGRDGERDARRA